MFVGGVSVIREGYYSYYGALFEIIVPGPIIENEDGTTSFLEPKPCFNCGSTDLELITNEFYDTPLYSVRCTKCLYSVSEDIKYYADSEKEGFLKAVEHWNIFCNFYYRAKNGYCDDDDFPTDKELYQPNNLHNTIAMLKAMSLDPYLEQLKK